MSRSRSERQRIRQREAKERARQERLRQRKRRRNLSSVIVIALVMAIGITIIVIQNSGQIAPEVDYSANGSSQAPDPDTPDPLPTKLPLQFPNPPPAVEALNTRWLAEIETNLGTIEVDLDGALAPQAVASFNFLAREGYFDGTACHRLLPSSLLQCGDPTATGTGGPGYSFGPIENAPTDDLYPAGTIAMARIGNDDQSMGSQFFLVFDDVTLPSDQAGGYTVMGKITNGLEILREVGAAGNLSGSAERPAVDVIIQHVEIK